MTFLSMRRINFCLRPPAFTCCDRRKQFELFEFFLKTLYNTSWAINLLLTVYIYPKAINKETVTTSTISHHLRL